MKKILLSSSIRGLLFILGLAFSTICFSGSIDTIPANNAAIEYTGRIYFSNPLAPMFSYSGVSIRACFSGTSIAAIMNDNIGKNYYNIILDGKLIDTINVNTGKKTYQLAAGLEDTVHEIEIFKRTEQEFGKTQFFGFVVDKGTTLSAVSKREKLIEYIGNSITCGYGNEGLLGGTFGPTTENHYLTYAAITSRNFNARHLAVCKSGIGIYRNYNGLDEGKNMTNLYTRTFLYDENPKYSFTDKPDLVCIDLGTNDFSTTGGDSAKYVSNFFRLIDTIQTKYTMPDIVCLLGPMLSGTTLTNIKNYLKFIADSATRKGKGNVYSFEMSAQKGDLGTAIDYHPTVAQHKKNAQELTDYIISLKGWKVYPSLTSANLLENNHIKVVFNVSLQDMLNNFAGFEVYADDQAIANSKVYLDSANNKVIHIITQQNFKIGEKINLSYTPGTIASTDSISIGAIDYFSIQNILTETLITKTVTNSKGLNITLTFNKNLRKDNSIDGLTITSGKGIVTIDSFKIFSTQLTLFLKDTILKGDSVFANYTGSGIYGIDRIPLNSFSKMGIINTSRITSISSISFNIVNIYPNPNNTGKFYYHINRASVLSNARLDIFNTSGAIVYSQKLSDFDGLIDLNGKISKGSYIFKFVIDKSIITRSIIKE